MLQKKKKMKIEKQPNYVYHVELLIYFIFNISTRL